MTETVFAPVRSLFDLRVRNLSRREARNQRRGKSEPRANPNSIVCIHQQPFLDVGSTAGFIRVLIAEPGDEDATRRISKVSENYTTLSIKHFTCGPAGPAPTT